MKTLLKKYGDDLLVLIGCGLILTGVVRLWPAAGWFVGGAMCIGWGIMIGRTEARA
jgi:hypothetical protein